MDLVINKPAKVTDTTAISDGNAINLSNKLQGLIEGISYSF